MMMYILVPIIAVLAIYLAFRNLWRLHKDASEIVEEFKTEKRSDLKAKWAGCGFVHTINTPWRSFWDGFCHIATDDAGIYVASWAMPNMYIPWSRIKKVGTKRLSLRSYHQLSIEGHPLITWHVPSKIGLPDSVESASDECDT